MVSGAGNDTMRVEGSGAGVSAVGETRAAVATSRAKSTAAATSALLRAATAQALGDEVQASSHPEVCVPPGCSPMKYGLASSSMRAAQAALAGALEQGARGDGTGISRPPTCFLSASQLAAEGHSGSDGRTRRAVATVRAGEHPQALAVDEIRNLIFSDNTLGDSVTVIDGVVVR